jgi:hypothetical protein
LHLLFQFNHPRTWERFRCTADAAGTGPSCADDPDNCISDKLVRQHADILAQPEWKSVGYEFINRPLAASTWAVAFMNATHMNEQWRRQMAAKKKVGKTKT